jgi:hypothetical protein
MLVRQAGDIPSVLLVLSLFRLPIEPNDKCSTATPGTVRSSYRGNLTFATFVNDTAPVCGTGGVRRGVWYTFLGTGEYIAPEFACQYDDEDISVSIYKGTCGKSTLQCFTAFRSFDCYVPTCAFQPDAGTTYYMLVYTMSFGGPVIFGFTLGGGPATLDNGGPPGKCRWLCRVRKWIKSVFLSI